MKRNLCDFAFVSVAEALQDDLPRLAKATGIRIPSLPMTNRSEFFYRPDSATLDAVARANALDLELHAPALKLVRAKTRP